MAGHPRYEQEIAEPFPLYHYGGIKQAASHSFTKVVHNHLPQYAIIIGLEFIIPSASNIRTSLLGPSLAINRILPGFLGFMSNILPPLPLQDLIC